MESSSKTINGRQLSVLIMVAIISTKLLLMPGLIASVSGRDAYLSYLITAIITFASIVIGLYILKNSTHESFYALLKHVFSGIGAKIVCTLFFVFFMSKIVLIDYQLESFLTEVLYDNLNWIIFVIPFYLVFSFMAYKGPRVLARTAEIIFPIAIAVLLLAVFSGIGNINFLNILPIGDTGAKAILSGAITGFGMGGEYLFMFIFIENLSEKSKIWKRSMWWALAGLLTVVIFLVIFTAVFGEIGMFVKDALTKMPSFSQNIKQNSEVNGIIVIGWTPLVVLESAINLYCAAWCVKQIFGIKQFAWCVVGCSLLVFGIKLIPMLSVFEFIKIIPWFYAALNAVLQIIIPSILFIYVLVEKRKRTQNSINATPPLLKGGKNEAK